MHIGFSRLRILEIQLHGIQWFNGFAQNGRGEEAIRIFNNMIQGDVRPDYVSFKRVLFACRHKYSGLVDQEREYSSQRVWIMGLKLELSIIVAWSISLAWLGR